MTMRFLCILSLLCGASFFAAALDREAFTIAKYDLDIRLEPQQQRLEARGKITLRNDSGQPQKVVALQLSSSLNWRASECRRRLPNIQAGTRSVQHSRRCGARDMWRGIPLRRNRQISRRGTVCSK